MAVPIKLAPRTCLMSDVWTASSLPELSTRSSQNRRRFPSHLRIPCSRDNYKGVSCSCLARWSKPDRRCGRSSLKAPLVLRPLLGFVRVLTERRRGTSDLQSLPVHQDRRGEHL